MRSIGIVVTVLVLLLVMVTDTSAMDGCKSPVEFYYYSTLKVSPAGPWMQFLTEYGYQCYELGGPISPSAVLQSYGSANPSMIAFLNGWVSAGAGGVTAITSPYSAAMEGTTSCTPQQHNYGQTIQHWDPYAGQWAYEPVLEWEAVQSGQYCCIDTTITAWPGSGARGISTQSQDDVTTGAAAKPEPPAIADPSDPANYTAQDLMRLARAHDAYLANRSNDVRRDSLNRRLKQALRGISPMSHEYAVRMEALRRADVSALAGWEVPLGTTIKRMGIDATDQRNLIRGNH